MASILTYAHLANAVYEDDPSVEGWVRADMQSTVSSLWEGDGFQGAAFKNADEIVFAFKGTANLQDVVTDIKLGVGMNTDQFYQGYQFVKRTQIPEGTKVTICGHSLGGAIAQIVGNRRRMRFVTFNAPGVGIVSRNLGEMAATVATGTMAIRTAGALVSAVRHPVQAMHDAGSFFNRVQGVNFRVGSDVVGSIGVHYGDVIELRYSGGALDLLAKHKMEAVLTALRESSYGGMQLSALV